jgi:hypothetical protein
MLGETSRTTVTFPISKVNHDIHYTVIQNNVSKRQFNQEFFYEQLALDGVVAFIYQN